MTLNIKEQHILVHYVMRTLCHEDIMTIKLKQQTKVISQV